MAELWKKIFKTHKNTGLERGSSSGAHRRGVGLFHRGQHKPGPGPDDIEQQLTNSVISGNEQQALDLLHKHPTPGNYDCLLRVCLLHIDHHCAVQAAEPEESGKSRGKRESDARGQFWKLRLELLETGPYDQDPGRLVNICRQLLPDRYDVVLAMCLQHIGHKGDNPRLCRMIAALLGAGSYQEQPRTLPALLRHNLGDFLDFADRSEQGGGGQGRHQQSGHPVREALQLRFPSSHRYKPSSGSHHPTSTHHLSSQGDSCDRTASWPHCNLVKTVLDSESFDLRLFYGSYNCSVGSLALHACQLLLSIRALRCGRLQHGHTQNPQQTRDLQHPNHEQKQPYQPPPAQDKNPPHPSPEQRTTSHQSLPSALVAERELCGVLAVLVEAGLCHLLDVGTCFQLPATSIYCPSLRDLLDVFAVVSDGLKDPGGSCVGPEAALLYEVGWLPRLSPRLRTWWDALANRLGDQEVKALAAKSCRVRSLKSVTAALVSSLVGYRPDRGAAVRALRLPADLEKLVMKRTYTEAYLSVVEDVLAYQS